MLRHQGEGGHGCRLRDVDVEPDPDPEVVDVVLDKRPAGAKPYKFPETCPVCGSHAVREEDEAVRRGLEGANFRRAEKVRRLEEWLTAHGLERAVVWAYGDSDGDRELLAPADHPMLVKHTTLTAVPEGFPA